MLNLQIPGLKSLITLIFHSLLLVSVLVTMAMSERGIMGKMGPMIFGNIILVPINGHRKRAFQMVPAGMNLLHLL